MTAGGGRRRYPPGRRWGAAAETYDFVIVGAGAAGCVLADRLSADPSARVLVLEAGRPDYRLDVYVHMPAALSFPIGNKRYDWMYESEPEPHMNGRRVYHARGKLFGGSSAINGMIFQRGNPLDLREVGVGARARALGLRALPPVLQADGDLPRRRRRVPRWRRAARARAGAGVDSRSSTRGSRRPSRRGTRSRTTSTGTGRKASRCSTATSTGAAG